MRSRRISGEKEQPVWVVVFDKGDEPVSGLLHLARSHDVEAGSLTAVGAFASATLGYFDADLRDYVRIEVDQQAEVWPTLEVIVTAFPPRSTSGSTRRRV